MVERSAPLEVTLNTNVPGETPSSGAPDIPIGGWLQVLCRLLIVWEPVVFAIVAAGAFNAISVRGLPVVLMLAARLVATAVCVAAGRSLLDRRAAGPRLARTALAVAAAVQVFAYVTPYFPSNRPPGQTPLYVIATLVYYGAWLAYLARSRRVAATYG
jgi:hypothetical protein